MDERPSPAPHIGPLGSPNGPSYFDISIIFEIYGQSKHRAASRRSREKLRPGAITSQKGRFGNQDRITVDTQMRIVIIISKGAESVAAPLKHAFQPTLRSQHESPSFNSC